MKKIIFAILILLLPILVEAKCSNKEVARLKALANQINITYDYVENNNNVTFSVTFHNVSKELKIVDNITLNNYTSNDLKDITISNIKFNGTFPIKILSNNSNCLNEYLGVKYYTIPTYNKYYNDKLCTYNKNKNVCQKWTNTNSLSYEEFQKILTEEQHIEKPNEKSSYDKFMDFFGNNYYIFLSTIIIISLFTIYFINKRNSYNFDI